MARRDDRDRQRSIRQIGSNVVFDCLESCRAHAAARHRSTIPSGADAQRN